MKVVHEKRKQEKKVASRKKPSKSVRGTANTAPETLPLREALGAIHQAALAAGVLKPISEERLGEYIRKEIRTSIEEAALGDQGPWWGMLVQDLTVPGMYVLVRIAADRVGLWSGKGDGPALKGFVEAHFSDALPSVLSKLKTQFGPYSWTGEVLRRDVQ